MIFDIIPYSTEKNLGLAYNQAIAALPDDAHICLRDGDTCWLTPDYGVHLAEYVRLHPDAVLTCWTNRINERAEQQLNIENVRDKKDMTWFITTAEHQKNALYTVTQLHGFVSGFCLVFPKSLWNDTKFPEKQMYEDRGRNNLLGVDNWFTNEVRRKGVPVLRMNGLMLYHTYRMLTNSNKHLL